MPESKQNKILSFIGNALLVSTFTSAILGSLGWLFEPHIEQFIVDVMTAKKGPSTRGELSKEMGVRTELVTIEIGKMYKDFSQTKQNLNSSTRPPQFATTEELDSLLVAGNLATLRSDGKRVEGPNFYITGRTSGPRGYEASVRWKLHEINQSMDINYNALHYNETWLASFENLFSLVAYGNDGYRVNIDEKFGGSKPYKCYFPAAPGDSGSAVLVDGEHFGDGSDTTPRIVGLLFAVNYTVKDPYPFSETSNTGYLTNCFTTYELNSTLQGLAFPKTAIICRIDEIAKELNIKSWNGEFIDDDGNPINFSNTDKREVIITKGGSEKKYIEKDGKKYWQVGRVNPELYDPTQDDDGNPTSVEVELERSKTLFNSRIEENATGEEAIYPHYKK